MENIKRFLMSQDGVTAIEYAIIAGLISILIVTASHSIGITLRDVFTDISEGFK